MSSRTTMTPIITPFRWLTLLSLPAYAAAQYGYYDGGGTSGRAIAGIVVAICFAILLFIFISLFFRRRRRGVPMLPWQGNTVPLGTHYPNQNQSSYPAMNHQSSWGPGAGAYQPPLGPPPPAEPMPPPPYFGKPPAYDAEENSGYGTPHSPTQQPQPQEAPQPGGFVVPQSPHSPAAAHVNSSPHSPWFRSS